MASVKVTNSSIKLFCFLKKSSIVKFNSEMFDASYTGVHFNVFTLARIGDIVPLSGFVRNYHVSDGCISDLSYYRFLISCRMLFSSTAV